METNDFLIYKTNQTEDNESRRNMEGISQEQIFQLNEVCRQIVALMIVSIVCSWIAWVWVKEKLFEEVQDWFKGRCENCKHPLLRKAYYMPTCEVCFVHYPVLILVLFRQYHLLEKGWIGLFYAWIFSSFAANVILTTYSLMRVGKKVDEAKEKVLQKKAD